MEIYYIYHIPERQKIGVSIDVKRRMRQHGWNGSYEILEQHEDPQVAGDRELELQQQYGYKVDLLHYTQTMENRHSFSSGHNYGKSGEDWKNVQSLGGIASTSKYETCPHCNTTMKVPIVYRYHFDNCKKKGHSEE